MKYSVGMVRKRLQRLILEGYFPSSKSLPTLQELAKIFRVSYVTVQEAMRSLQDSGLVVAKRGQGVFVKYPLRWNSRGRTVALLSPFLEKDLDNTPYPRVAVQELRQTLEKNGYRLEPISIKELGLIDIPLALQDRKLAGIVLLEIASGRLLEELGDLGLPLVSMDYDRYQSAVPSVSFDNLRGGFQATRHLLEKGHERIAFARIVGHRLQIRNIMGHQASLDPVDDDRIRGYQLAM